MYHYLSPVTIGFNQTTYSVREDAGSVPVSVSVMSGTISQDVIITLSTSPGGTATGGIDFGNFTSEAKASITDDQCYNSELCDTIIFYLH